MKIYDITQEILHCEVYPGDPVPQLERLKSMQEGEVYNLSALHLCVHNGTHVDAPFHFLSGGKTVDQMAPDHFAGMAYVLCREGDLREEEAWDMLRQARTVPNDAWRRLLIRGNAVVREEAAQVFADAGVYLVGTESQSVGPEEAPMRVHRILLSREVVLLEGIRLDEVPSGCYLLNASPLKIAGSDGAPCRAILMDWHEQEDTWLAEAVERIRSMEVIYDRLCEALDQDMSDPQWAFLLDTLKDYYEHGLWLSDYERDERGELPAALKRGVLSQDAVYHLLCDWDARRREKHV